MVIGSCLKDLGLESFFGLPNPVRGFLVVHFLFTRTSMGTILGARQSTVVLDSKEAFWIQNPNCFLTFKNYDLEYQFKLAESKPDGHSNFQFDDTKKPPKAIVGLKTQEEYVLKKIHIHTHSEHVVDSEWPDEYEIHLLHFLEGKGVTGPKLVLAFLGSLSGKNSKGKSAHILQDFDTFFEKYDKKKTKIASLKGNLIDKEEGEINKMIVINPQRFFPGENHDKTS